MCRVNQCVRHYHIQRSLHFSMHKFKIQWFLSNVSAIFSFFYSSSHLQKFSIFFFNLKSNLNASQRRQKWMQANVVWGFAWASIHLFDVTLSLRKCPRYLTGGSLGAHGPNLFRRNRTDVPRCVAIQIRRGRFRRAKIVVCTNENMGRIRPIFRVYTTIYLHYNCNHVPSAANLCQRVLDLGRRFRLLFLT